jgi:uncharacterized membrane protein YagU involved in acid resistance
MQTLKSNYDKFTKEDKIKGNLIIHIIFVIVYEFIYNIRVSEIWDRLKAWSNKKDHHNH